MRVRAVAALAIPLSLSAATGCQPRAASAPPADASPAFVPDPMRPLPDPLPAVAARVNGEDIPTRNVAIMVVESIETGKAPQGRRNALFREALDQLIKRELLLQEAQARRVQAEDLDVQRAYDRMRGEHRDEAAWNGFLQDRSLTDGQLRAELRTRYTVQALLAQEAQKETVTASEDEVRALYDQTDASKFQPKGASPGHKPPFDVVEELMRQEVLKQKYAAASERFVQSLAARARIEKFL